MTTELDQILLRRDVAAQWSALNPTLGAGEAGFETDTLRFKIGNGALAWNSLAYQGGGGGSGGDLTVTGSVGSPELVEISGSIPNLNFQREYIFVAGHNVAVICAFPQLVAGIVIGQELYIQGCSSTRTVRLNDGTGLVLNGACTLYAGSVISLLWDGVNWVEAGRNGIVT